MCEWVWLSSQAKRIDDVGGCQSMDILVTNSGWPPPTPFFKKAVTPGITCKKKAM